MTREELEKEAKEIISEFVEWANWQSGGNCPSFKSIQDKAEQFLKEEQMTDKIKLKADKFVNDRKLKLNYLKPKDLKILLAEFCKEQIAELEKELEEEKKLNAEIKARFVKCNTCTDEMKSKCLMFSENLCEGERCEELVDLMGLISKSELEKENAELKEELTKKADTNHSLVEQMADLESENAELKDLLQRKEMLLTSAEITAHNEGADKIALLKENAELKKMYHESDEDNNKLRENIPLLAEAKELLEWFVWYFREGSPNLVPYKHKVEEAEQFLKNDGCPDVMCEDCTKEDCGIKKLGLVEVEK